MNSLCRSGLFIQFLEKHYFAFFFLSFFFFFFFFFFGKFILHPPTSMRSRVSKLEFLCRSRYFITFLGKNISTLTHPNSNPIGLMVDKHDFSVQV